MDCCSIFKPSYNLECKRQKRKEFTFDVSTSIFSLIIPLISLKLGLFLSINIFLTFFSAVATFQYCIFYRYFFFSVNCIISRGLFVPLRFKFMFGKTLLSFGSLYYLRLQEPFSLNENYSPSIYSSYHSTLKHYFKYIS